MDGIARSARYAVAEIASHWNEWFWWKQRLLVHLNGTVQTSLYPGRKGVDVPAADWDTLLVLDACRADLFEETVDVGRFDTYSRAQSRASATEEWLKVNFPDTYGDIVYVAGNPQVSLHKPDCWHHLSEVWRDAYDQDQQIIAAPPVAEAALEARERYPDKRMIVHFMQPHVPFVDAPDLQFCTYGEFNELSMEGDSRAANVFEAVAKGIVDFDEMWDAYAHTLEYVMSPVEDILEAFDDRVVITSDHGNLVEARSWPIPFRYHQHELNQRHPELTTVPWAVVDGTERLETTTEEIQSSTTAADAEVQERLRNLGYAE